MYEACSNETCSDIALGEGVWASTHSPYDSEASPHWHQPMDPHNNELHRLLLEPLHCSNCDVTVKPRSVAALWCFLERVLTSMGFIWTTFICSTLNMRPSVTHRQSNRQVYTWLFTNNAKFLLPVMYSPVVFRKLDLLYDRCPLLSGATFHLAPTFHTV